VLDQEVGQVLEVKLLGKDGNVKIIIMEKMKMLINHPLSKAIACGIVGSMLLLEGHALYSGIAFGMGLREMLLAFKTD
jgi:hypothetical protein